MFKQNLFGIDDFRLNFFATFGSVFGLQATVVLQVNTGLQPTTFWEPFVAGTILCRPEPTKERVEPTNLSIIINTTAKANDTTDILQTFR